MDLFSLVEWYEINAFWVMPILISIFILGLSLAVFQLTDDRFFRLAWLIPVGISLLAFSQYIGDYGAELYLNLSMEIFMTLFAVLVLALATQFESWFVPIVIVAVLALGLQFFVSADNVGTSIPLTFSTGMVGALTITFMLRQEWAWSPVMKEKRLSSAMRKARKEQAQADAEFGDYFMLVAGRDEDYIQQKIDFLKDHDMTLIRQQEIDYDKEGETYYRLINVRIDTVVKDPSSVLLSNQEARVQLLGYPDTVKRVYKQLTEVVIGREQKRLDAPNNEMVHLEFKTDVPAKLYSSILEEKFYELARTWQYSDDEHLQQATDSLMDWAKAEGLVK
ncbi:MAG: hypothetical protein Phog2KO_31010 [Phototrophicaceae bacterium]